MPSFDEVPTSRWMRRRLYIGRSLREKEPAASSTALMNAMLVPDSLLVTFTAPTGCTTRRV